MSQWTRHRSAANAGLGSAARYSTCWYARYNGRAFSFASTQCWRVGALESFSVSVSAGLRLCSIPVSGVPGGRHPVHCYLRWRRGWGRSARGMSQRFPFRAWKRSEAKELGATSVCAPRLFGLGNLTLRRVLMGSKQRRTSICQA